MRMTHSQRKPAAKKITQEMVEEAATAICEFRDPERLTHPERPFCSYSREMAKTVLRSIGYE
jgi:malic enzyme